MDGYNVLCFDKLCKNILICILVILDKFLKWNGVKRIFYGGYVGLVGVIVVLMMCDVSIFWCIEEYINIDMYSMVNIILINYWFYLYVMKFVV